MAYESGSVTLSQAIELLGQMLSLRAPAEPGKAKQASCCDISLAYTDGMEVGVGLARYLLSQIKDGHEVPDPEAAWLLVDGCEREKRRRAQREEARGEA